MALRGWDSQKWITRVEDGDVRRPTDIWVGGTNKTLNSRQDIPVEKGENVIKICVRQKGWNSLNKNGHENSWRRCRAFYFTNFA